MALAGTGSILANVIINDLDGLGLFDNAPQKAQALERVQVWCDAIVAHIIQFADVQVTVPPSTYSFGTSPAVAPVVIPVPVTGLAGTTGGVS